MTALMTNLPITAAVGLAIAATVDLVVVVAVVDLAVIAAAIGLLIQQRRAWRLLRRFLYQPAKNSNFRH